jgi:general secretion pathway protein D
MIKPPLVTISILGLIAMAQLNVRAAQNESLGSVPSVAEREISRREDNVNRAKKAIAEGDKAMDAKTYDVAVMQYKSACDLLPESQVVHDLRLRAVDRFSEASVKLAEQRVAEGRFADAEATAKLVVDERYNPGYKPALQLLSHLEDPGYFNKTVGPKFYANVQDVKRLFTEAQGFYDSARYDLAFKRCEQILGIDPYNIAARRMQEKIDAARDHYADNAYNETRGRRLWQVTKGWEIPPRKYQGREVVKYDSGVNPIRNTEAIQNLLNSIIIPKIEFREATVREAVDFLKQKSKELDPNKKGVNIVLKLEGTPGSSAPAPEVPGTAAAPTTPSAPSVNPTDARITLSLTNIPLSEALRYITSLAGLKVKIDQYAVTVVPLSEITDTLITKEYKVPPGFLSTQGASASGALSAPAGRTRGAAAAGGDATGAGQNIAVKQTALEYLTAQGVVFPPGASANFLPSSSKLIVRNTEANLDLVDTIVEALRDAAPVQVEIESKFVEITQTNLKELSFDWNVASNATTGGGTLRFGGGSSTQLGATDTTSTNATSLTGSNRSGTAAISANAIDALLLGTTGGSSGVFSALALTNPQVSVVINALNQKKGVDLLSAPRVTTKSGQRAVIEIIREFKYPTEFQPPQVPQSTNGQSVVVTPTTPTAFEVRNTGVTLEVEPVVGPDGQTIDLNLVPQVVEFEGFINYGSPIFGLSISQTQGFFNNIGNFVPGVTSASSTLLTNNVINQPIFSTRKVTTSVSVWDGQTVVLGGLMREDVQKVQDKIPLLGDIPLLGRLFRSDVDQHQKRNLVIFVTARLMNPAGEPVRDEEEKEEEVAPLTQPDLLTPALPEAPLFQK